MDPDSEDIQHQSILTEYHLEKYYLTNFTSLLSIIYSTCIPLQDAYDDNTDNDQLDPKDMDMQDTNLMKLSNGIVIKKRKNKKL